MRPLGARNRSRALYKWLASNETHLTAAHVHQDRVKHGFVEQHVAHPLANDNVHFLDRELDILHFALDDSDHIGKPIFLNVLSSLDSQTGGFDGIYVLGPGLGSEH